MARRIRTAETEDVALRRTPGPPVPPAQGRGLWHRAGPLVLRPKGSGRRIGVIVLGVILAAVACGILGVPFVQGSWWYSYGTDRALDDRSLARLGALREEIDTSGLAPKAVASMDAALDPSRDPTAVRTCLLTAQEAMKAADDPALAEAVKRLQDIIQRIRPSGVREPATVYPASALERPE